MIKTDSRVNRAEHPLMTALGRGVPITLLVDLLDPSGPASSAVFEHEGLDLDAAGGRGQVGWYAARTA